MEMNFSMIKARIAEDNSERRQYSRHRVTLDATVRELGTTGIEASVLNISEQGFMAQSEAEFEVGSRVWLILPGRERANAVVKWIAGDKLGAEFAEPITLSGLNAAGRRG
jgi:phage FluMu gp28-like protein